VLGIVMGLRMPQVAAMAHAFLSTDKWKTMGVLVLKAKTQVATAAVGNSMPGYS
jgi:hypothetical protein